MSVLNDCNYTKYKRLRKGVTGRIKEYKKRIEKLDNLIRNSSNLDIYSNYLKEQRTLKSIILDLEGLL